jgi:hypothetical protein
MVQSLILSVIVSCLTFTKEVCYSLYFIKVIGYYSKAIVQLTV